MKRHESQCKYKDATKPARTGRRARTLNFLLSSPPPEKVKDATKEGKGAARDQFKCQYASDGCDFGIDKTVILDHEAECRFRRVPCPDGLCSKEVMASELVSHIKTEHADAVWEGDPGSTMGRIWFIDSKMHFNTNANNWVLNIWQHDGNTFIARFRKMNGLWYSWVYVLGGAKTAGQFMSEIATENPDGNADCALLYLGRVHAVDESEEDITKSGDCFVMTNEVVKNHGTQVKKVNMFKEGYDTRLGMDYTIMKTEPKYG